MEESETDPERTDPEGTEDRIAVATELEELVFGMTSLTVIGTNADARVVDDVDTEVGVDIVAAVAVGACMD